MPGRRGKKPVKSGDDGEDKKTFPKRTRGKGKEKLYGERESTTGGTPPETSSNGDIKTAGINYISNPHLLPPFWAAVNSFFQRIMDRFLMTDGWTFKDFCEIAQKYKLRKVFNCACSNSGDLADKIEHYKICLAVIFDAAKFQWLTPWRWHRVETMGIFSCFKRQVGGLYLLYSLCVSQPEPPVGHLITKRRIHTCLDDIYAIKLFFRNLRKIGSSKEGMTLKDECISMFKILQRNKLFKFNFLKDMHELREGTILLLEAKNSRYIAHFALLKDIRDSIIFAMYSGAGSKIFSDLMLMGHKLFVDAERRNLSAPGPPKRQRKLLTGRGITPKFPPQAKSTITAKDIEDLKSDRDLAIIGFRIAEFLKYLTPPAVITDERLTGSVHIRSRVETEVENIAKDHVEEVLLWRESSRAKPRRDGRSKNYDLKGTRAWKAYIGIDFSEVESDRPKPETILDALFSETDGDDYKLHFYPKLLLKPVTPPPEEINETPPPPMPFIDSFL